MDFFKVAENIKALTPKVIIQAQIRMFDEKRVVKSNQEQLIDGIKADGSPMPDLSETSIQIKKQEGGFINSTKTIALKNFGDFHEKMFLKKDKDKGVINSTDSKSTELQKRYPNSLGLTEENEQKEIEKSNPLFIKLIEKVIFR